MRISDWSSDVCSSDLGIGLEIGGAIARAGGVGPEADRHARERLHADQLALLAAHRPAVVVEHLDRHAEAAALDLAAPNRAARIAADEAGDDVGAAGDRRQPDVVLDVAADVVETIRPTPRAGPRP